MSCGWNYCVLPRRRLLFLPPAHLSVQAGVLATGRRFDSTLPYLLVLEPWRADICFTMKAGVRTSLGRETSDGSGPCRLDACLLAANFLLHDLGTCLIAPVLEPSSWLTDALQNIPTPVQTQLRLHTQ
ncbi:hypothetical protein BJ170DRAFT_599989 [Xylariales sp. AK1849]|nr:hypothetical protein BJ170DRAFT_599989 [Xylariales sp. AK1849]